MVRLETNETLGEAIAQCRSAGYVEVDAFNDEPYAHHWLEKRLSSRFCTFPHVRLACGYRDRGEERVVPEPDDKVVADPMAEEERPPEEDGDAEDAESDDVDEIEAQASELLEQVGRDASVLVLREVELTTSRHIPELRRAARDISVVVGVGLAFVTAFVLVNWAIVYALSSPLPSWRAPLVLAAVWAAIGLLLVVFVLHRTGQVVGWRWWKATGADPEEIVRGREEARDDAQHTLRESLQQFAGAVAREAGVLVTAAVVPIAGGAADAGEKVLDAVDDVTDVIEEKLPGGGVINRVTDLALKPGRYALGAVNKGLKRDEPGSG